MFRATDQIGSYFLIEKLGRGAFGEVWLAEEKTAISTHKVALKLPNSEDIDFEAIRQEAGVWEDVKGHPNILPIIKADIIDEQVYIASEYAPDGSLSDWLKTCNGKAPTIEVAVKMTKGILSGLEHLHSKGVIHRDLKPANILLQANTPRIADFGIARLVKSTSSTTQSAGTPSYMAPECFYAIRSVQTDIWAVGVLFNLLLTGHLPFPQPDPISVMNAILNSEPQIHAGIPTKLKEVIHKALHKDLTQRYQSALEMRMDLSNFSSNFYTETEKKIIQLNFDKEEETLVSNRLPKPQIQTIISNFSSLPKIITVTLVLLSILAATIWVTFQFGRKQNTTETSVPDINNETTVTANSNSIDVMSGLVNLANETTDNSSIDKKETIANSTVNSAYEMDYSNDSYNPRTDGTSPSVYVPYKESPGEQVYTIDPNNANSIYMQDGTVLVPVPTNTNTSANVKPPATSTGKPTPASANTAQPQPTPAAETKPTPPAKTPTPAPKPTTQPAKTPPAANDRSAQGGKEQDS